MQIPAIQRHENHVDKNLYGVSGRVTVPGVLAFRYIFPALRAGNAGRSDAPQKSFAREHVRDRPGQTAAASTQRKKPRRRPIKATAGNEQMSGA